VRKGVEHKHYKMMPNIFISISETKKEIHETGFLKRIFRDGIKFASIGIAAFLVWFIPTTSGRDYHDPNGLFSTGLFFALLTIIVGLILVIIQLIKKRKRN